MALNPAIFLLFVSLGDLGNSERLTKLRPPERLDAYFGLKLMKFFPPLITGSPQGLGELIDFPIALGERLINMLDGQMLEFPRLIFLRFGQLIESIPAAK